jgi:lipoic acid synthetase
MLAIAEKTGIYPSALLRSTPLRIYDCGLADYRDVLQQQHELRDKRRRGEIPNTVLIVEHPAVITLGARQNANKLRADRESLKEQNIDVVDIRRGGGTTAHNPGQLVFYPILDLREVELGVSEYIRKLEEIGIELLEQLGVSAKRQKGFPGLWANNRKIASIGVRVSKFVTYHGMAINIQNDLGIFDHIIPCGLDEVEMTSVLTETEAGCEGSRRRFENRDVFNSETGREHSMAEVKGKLSQLLIRHLSKPNEQRAANYQRRKLPAWLKRPLPAGESYNHTKGVLSFPGLETICDNANCPNRGECWARGTATVLILGNICTRNCKFCSVASGRPQPPDPAEPARIAEMAKKMGLKYLVITSVTRDDLADGGAAHFRNCINKVRQQHPDMQFEILTPDFQHCQERAIEILAGALPFVFAHNVETVPALYPAARAGGDYQLSLNLLKMAKQSYEDVLTKSSIMLGLGETDAEVEQVLRDLRNAGCDRITIGQYLKPSKDSLDVVEYIAPQKFEWWKQKAISLGFSWVISLPFARSSYFAEREDTL